jgi:hypothetical protein
MPTRKPAAGKKTAAKEPLLNAVARKLGYVAGTLTHVAQGLAGASPAERSGKDFRAKQPKASASRIKKSRHRKNAAAASLSTPKSRTRTLGKKAAASGVARIPRKRAAKS